MADTGDAIVNVMPYQHTTYEFYSGKRLLDWFLVMTGTSPKPFAWK